MMIGPQRQIEPLNEQVELFLFVPKDTNIIDFTYRISIQTDQKPQETIYYESPIQNVQSFSSLKYKQLPRTVKLTFEFESKQYLTITVLNRSTLALYGVSTPISLNMINSLRQEINVIPIKSGQLIVSQFAIHSKAISSKSHETTIAIDTFNIEKKASGWCCLSAPQPIQYYYMIHQKISNGTTLLGRSRPVLNKSLQPEHMRLITSNDKEIKQIIVTFYQKKTQMVIGETLINLAQWKSNKQYFLNGKNKTDGYFKLDIISNQKRYNFLQFYKSGMELALEIAIDFTLSNHYYRQQRSLHYSSDTKPSVYQQVLRKISPILLDFDSNKKVPVYGMGAIQCGEQKVSHRFPLAKNNQNFEVYQVEGIINIYKQVLPTLKFSGPSYLAPLLKQSIKESYRMKKEKQQYKILLILTDGDIYDYQQTVDLVVECSQLPISIIIVGISRDPNQKWPLMHKLNNNNLELKNRQGIEATRDMVTFVPYFQCINIPGKFQRELLKQLTTQISQYHRLAKIPPQAYKIRKAGMDSVDAQKSDIIKMQNRLASIKEINPEQIKPIYEQKMESSILKLPQNSNLKTKQRVKQYYQQRQQ